MSIQLNRDEFVPGACDEYDPRLLERRNFAEGNVCGCLLNDLDLFDDCSFIPDDFVTFHGRLLYSIIKQLHNKGVKKFDEVTFVTTLPEDFVKTVDETYGGYIQITNLMRGIDNKNWDTYKEALNKSNILLRLYKKGFNIFGKITLDNGKKIIPFDFFEGLTSTEILEFYEGTIASIQTHVDNLKLIEEGYIEFDDEWIEKLKKKEEMGVSYGEAGVDIDGEEIRTFPFMSNNTLGLQPGTLSAWGALSGVGKSIPNYTIIPTPNGPRKVGDIRPGDYLFGSDGKPTKVLMIHPQKEQKEIWKVIFKDGRVAECCKDHLWEYGYRAHRGTKYSVASTEEIYNKAKGSFKYSSINAYKYNVRLNKAVQYTEKNLPIHPYVLGALLGDGYIAGRYVEFSSETDEIPQKINSFLADAQCIKVEGQNQYRYKIADNSGVWISTSNFLKDLPQLIGTHSGDKFIPDEYLTSSVSQRMLLLQGLMDTDGTIDLKGRVSYYTTSEKLKDGFVMLCRSLGFVASVNKDHRTHFKSGVGYSIQVQTPKEVKSSLFLLGRKVERANTIIKKLKVSNNNTSVSIVDIHPTGVYTDMTCFTVEAEDHLFLTNDYIVTHNTQYMATIAMSVASKGEKVVMVTNESYLKDLKAIFLAWIVYRVLKYDKLSKRKILSGDFTDEDLQIIKKAQVYWKAHYEKQIKIVTLSDADAQFSCQIIKRAILREGATVFIVDTMKMTLSDDANDNSWIGLIRDVRALTEVATKYNVIGIITVQLAPSTANRTWLDVSCLANCKQMKETLSNLVLFRKMRACELDPDSQFYIHPFRRKQRNDGSGEWYDEPYEADPSKTYIIAFTDKNRRGTDSGMDGTAFLCRTDLDHASFFETARCYPTNKSFSPNER